MANQPGISAIVEGLNRCACDARCLPRMVGSEEMAVNRILDAKSKRWGAVIKVQNIKVD